MTYRWTSGIFLFLSFLCIFGLYAISIAGERFIAQSLQPRIAGHLRIESSRPLPLSTIERVLREFPQSRHSNSLTTTSTFLTASGNPGLISVIGVDDAFPLIPVGTFSTGSFHQSGAVISPELQEKYFQKSPTLPLGNLTLPITGIMLMPVIATASFGAEAQPLYVPLSSLEQSGLIASGSRLTYAHTIYLQQLELLPRLEEQLRASLSGSRVRFDRYDQMNGRLSEGLDGVRLFASSVLATLLFLALSVVLLRSLREYLREFPRFRTAYLLGTPTTSLLHEWIVSQLLPFGTLLIGGGIILFAINEFYWIGVSIAVFLMGAHLFFPVCAIQMLPKTVLDAKYSGGRSLWIGIGGLLAAGLTLLSWLLQNATALWVGILGSILVFVYAKFYEIITNRILKIPKTFSVLEPLRILFRPGSLYILTFPLITILFVFLASSLQIGWQTYERVRPGEIGPNFFALNLLQQDIPPLRQMGYSGMIYEVVRARIDSINKQPLGEFLGERGEDREFTREFNIATSLPNIPAPELGTVTVDEEFSKRLGITLGDTLEFSFLGKIRSGKIVAIRPSQLTEGIQPFFYFAIHPDFFGKQTPKNYFLADIVVNPKELSRKLYALSARIISIDVREIQLTIAGLLNQLFLAVGGIFAILIFFASVVLLLLLGVLRPRGEYRRFIAEKLGYSPENYAQLESCERWYGAVGMCSFFTLGYLVIVFFLVVQVPFFTWNIWLTVLLLVLGNGTIVFLQKMSK